MTVMMMVMKSFEDNEIADIFCYGSDVCSDISDIDANCFGDKLLRASVKMRELRVMIITMVNIGEVDDDYCFTCIIYFLFLFVFNIIVCECV